MRGSSDRLYRYVTALSMTVGRGAAARVVADLAQPRPGDTLVDVGCGPGAAARAARRRGSTVIGVDPDPLMLGLARKISAVRRCTGISWVRGRAESLPLRDASATILWALSAYHDWQDSTAGLAEAARVLAPGGRVLVAERLVGDGAHGHAAHGLTSAQAEELAGNLSAAGFVDVHSQIRSAGRRTLVIVGASRRAAG